MNIGDAYRRKNFEYKIVAKVPHEFKEDEFVYMIAQREYGSEEVSYFIRESEFGSGFWKTNWIGV